MKLPHEVTKLFWQKALRRYLGTDDEAFVRSVEDKARLISYTRLMRRTIRRNGLDTPDGRAVIDLCKRPPGRAFAKRVLAGLVRRSRL